MEPISSAAAGGGSFVSRPGAPAGFGRGMAALRFEAALPRSQCWPSSATGSGRLGSPANDLHQALQCILPVRSLRAVAHRLDEEDTIVRHVLAAKSQQALTHTLWE